MAEPTISEYNILFELRLLHHYWLDKGATVFDQIPNQLTRDKLLLTYNLRSFMAVTPTDSTVKALDGFRCLCKDTALGCVVVAPTDTEIPPETTFDFVVTIQNSAFYNYTALTMRPQKIYELFYQPENKIYRYKENVPVLSNQTGVSRSLGAGKLLFLSREIPVQSGNEQVEWLVRVPSGPLLQMISDQPGDQPKELDAQAANMPVFVHQGDVPPITPPAGLAGAPARGIRLSSDIPDTVYALIQLVASGAGDNDYDFVNGSGRVKPHHPIYQVRFKNRSTHWQYLNQQTGEPVNPTIPTMLYPLTHFGNAGIKQKPSHGLVKTDFAGRLVSEIYI